MSNVLLLFRAGPRPEGPAAGRHHVAVPRPVFRIEPDLAHGLATLDANQLPGGFGPMYLVTIFLVLTFLFSANTWTRASRVSVALPVATRTTWLVRTASLISVAVATVFSMALALGLSLRPTTISLNPVIALAALRATATAALRPLVPTPPR